MDSFVHFKYSHLLLPQLSRTYGKYLLLDVNLNENNGLNIWLAPIS